MKNAAWLSFILSVLAEVVKSLEPLMSGNIDPEKIDPKDLVYLPKEEFLKKYKTL